jgi:hypothetical protein
MIFMMPNGDSAQKAGSRANQPRALAFPAAPRQKNSGPTAFRGTDLGSFFREDTGVAVANGGELEGTPNGS